MKQWIWFFIPHKHNFIFSHYTQDWAEVGPVWDRTIFTYERSKCIKCGRTKERYMGSEEVNI